MSFELESIQRIKGIDRKTFEKEFLRPKIPVIIEDFAKGWPALDKWSLDHFRKVAGDTMVPLYDNSKVDYTKKVNEPIARMTFTEYLDLIEEKPTDLRIFLFNIFKNVPELCGDFFPPEIAPNVLTKFPMMFFGGKDSKVFLHYDLDLSHVFLTQFHAPKSAILFHPKYSKDLYRVPFAVHNIEDIDMDNPDFDKWPALKNVKGIKALIQPGETLFMPSGWWHYNTYVEGSYSLALRSMDPSPFTKLKGIYNVTLLRQFDNMARKIGGQGWIDFKDRLAIQRAHRNLTL
ncbi:MAG: cupin-like domain-containing protein [Bacteroidota bacterium]|nr:cupin-like domain-containing protein [Bacteroidota bacterium]